MDPWADTGTTTDNEAGPSWSGSVSQVAPASGPSSSSPQLSPTRFRDAGPVDPWAENDARGALSATDDGRPLSSIDVARHDELLAARSADAIVEQTQRGRSASIGSKDFDPWGGGSAPIAPLGSTPSAYRSDSLHDGAVEDTQDIHAEGWQGTKERSGAVEHDILPQVDKDTESIPETFDEDDPWGSGAQARRLKAESMAQQMEILRLQEEAKGKHVVDAEETEVTAGEEERSRTAIANGQEREAKDSAEGGKTSTRIEEDKTSGSAPTGWRALFSRATTKPDDPPELTADVKAAADTARKSTEAKESPRSSTSVSAPRLWQAPTLRTGHNRTTSTTSQGSAGLKDALQTQPASTTSQATSAEQGPGWAVATKKQPATSSGFIQSLLGSGQHKDPSSGLGLSRFGQSLQRPSVQSATEYDPEDDSVEVEDTGIEWEAGNAFNESGPKQQAKPQTDLLSNDPPQESTVTRLFGRWRGKQTSAGDEAKKDGMSGDDLSWLENMGAESSVQTAGREPLQTEADWLAFVESDDDKKPSTTPQNPARAALPKAGDRISIPNVARLTASKPQPRSFNPPPRLNAPPQRSGSLRGTAASGVGGDADASPDPDDTFGSFYEGPQPATSYHDEPVDHDDALLKQKTRPLQRRNPGSSSLLSSLSGRPIKPYSYDDDDDETHEDSGWSAFRDVPYDDAPHPSTMTRPARLQTDQPARQTPAMQSPSKAPAQIPSRTSTPGSIGSGGGGAGGLLPPPPGSHRVITGGASGSVRPPAALPSQPSAPMPKPVSAPMPKTLSQGKTLTNDDLSFFENL